MLRKSGHVDMWGKKEKKRKENKRKTYLIIHKFINRVHFEFIPGLPYQIYFMALLFRILELTYHRYGDTYPGIRSFHQLETVGSSIRRN